MKIFGNIENYFTNLTDNRESFIEQYKKKSLLQQVNSSSLIIESKLKIL